MLKDHLLLHVCVAVTAARQLEVSFHERTGALEHVQHFRLVHRNVSAIASVAVRGSSARVIGRPITIRSAPASMASLGVRTRACSSRSAPAGLTPGVTTRNGFGHTARTASMSGG